MLKSRNENSLDTNSATSPTSPANRYDEDTQNIPDVYLSEDELNLIHTNDNKNTELDGSSGMFYAKNVENTDACIDKRNSGVIFGDEIISGEENFTYNSENFECTDNNDEFSDKTSKPQHYYWLLLWLLHIIIIFSLYN